MRKRTIPIKSYLPPENEDLVLLSHQAVPSAELAQSTRPSMPVTPACSSFRFDSFKHIEKCVLFKPLFGFDTKEELHWHWNHFQGTIVEFAYYAECYTGDWSSLHVSDTLSPEALLESQEPYLQEKSALEMADVARDAQMVCEYLYGENVSFYGFGEVIEESISSCEESSELRYHSRCNGNHARYKRRVEKAKADQRKIQRGITAVYNSDGTLSIAEEFLRKRYMAAKEALELVPFLREKGIMVSIRTYDSLVHIIRKYKKLVHFADHFDTLIDGRYFSYGDANKTVLPSVTTEEAGITVTTHEGETSGKVSSGSLKPQYIKRHQLPAKKESFNENLNFQVENRNEKHWKFQVELVRLTPILFT